MFTQAQPPLSGTDTALLAQQRLAALKRYELLLSEPDPALDNITAIVQQVFDASVAFVALVDTEQVYFLSQAGRMSKNIIDQSDLLFAQSIRLNEADLPEGAGRCNILKSVDGGSQQSDVPFFAVVPLRTADKLSIGVLAIAGNEPRNLGAADKLLLERFSDTVMHLMEQHIAVRQQVAMKENQQKLMALVNNSIELMSVLELDGKNSYLNKAGMEMLGFDNFEQVLVTPISDLHQPEDIAFVEANVLPSVMQTGRWSGRMNVRHLKTGEVFPVYNNTVRIDDPATGRPLAIGAVMRDMRPELAQQQELIISEDEMRNALEAAEMGYWNVDPQALTLRCNEKTKELFGLPHADVVDLTLATEAIYEPDRDRVSAAMTRAMTYESGGEYEIEYTVISKRDKKARLVRAKGRTYFDENNRPYQFSGTVQDVTEQRLQERKLRLVLESLPQMAWTATAEGLVDSYNRTWYQYTGQTPDEALGEGWAAVMHPHDLERMAAEWRTCVAAGTVFEQEARYRRNDGAYRWHLTRGVPIKDEAGQVLFFTGTCTDIHDQKAAAEVLEQKISERTRELQETNKQLERTNMELEQFAHVSSHDLQEPLRKITLFTEMVRESSGHLLDEPALERLSKVSEAARRMSASLRALLNYTQVQGEVHWDTVDLNQVMADVSNDLEVVIQQKEAQLRCSHLPLVRGQLHQLKQLLYNLVNNSLKFTHPDRKPVITITAAEVPRDAVPEGLSKEKRYCAISIRDNGVGFDSQQADKLFNLFQRLHNRAEYPGTGIGLALCKKVVQKHGGAIRAEATAGEGAVFHVMLPIL